MHVSLFFFFFFLFSHFFLYSPLLLFLLLSYVTSSPVQPTRSPPVQMQKKGGKRMRRRMRVSLCKTLRSSLSFDYSFSRVFFLSHHHHPFPSRPFRTPTQTLRPPLPLTVFQSSPSQARPHTPIRNTSLCHLSLFLSSSFSLVVSSEGVLVFVREIGGKKRMGGGRTEGAERTHTQHTHTCQGQGRKSNDSSMQGGRGGGRILPSITLTHIHYHTSQKKQQQQQTKQTKQNKTKKYPYVTYI